MHNDHAQFDAHSPLNLRHSGARAKPKGLMLAAAGLGGAIVGWFIPIGLVESVTTATGLSEMIPALAPPLGSTMRILLALAGGVSSIAMAALFLGGGRAKPATGSADHRVRRDMDNLHSNIGKDRAAHGALNASDPDFIKSYAVERNNGETPMARHANVRQSVRDFEMNETPIAEKSGGFLDRVKQSLSKLPLPRRFEDDSHEGGSIRDFSDLKRLRPGGDDARDSLTLDSHHPVRPIAAHAELGDPLPPLQAGPSASLPLHRRDEYGDDLAELERSARLAADRFATGAPQTATAPAPVLQPQETLPASPHSHGPIATQTAPTTANAVAPELLAEATATIRQPAKPSAPVRYDAEGIDALVERLERALSNVRPVPAAVAGVDQVSPELDLAGFAEEHMTKEMRAEDQHMAEERAAEEARQAAIAAEDEAKRRADALAAQEAARKAAEDADRAAEEARRRAAEAQALLASLGVEQTPAAQDAKAAPNHTASAPTALRAVEPSPTTSVEPEMDDALRSALRTLRRMSNP